MLTLDDFLKEYDNYTDEQLQNLYLNREDYSEEANQAMRTFSDESPLNKVQ